MVRKTKVSQVDQQAILARQNALYTASFLSIGEGAIATDESGNISRVNNVALELLGYRSKDLIGKWYMATIDLTDEDGKIIPTIERPMTRAFISGKPVSLRCYIRCKNKLLLPIALTVSPILLNNKPVGAIEVFRDITKELEVDRLKSEFISLASHQLRTPATVVKTYISMLKDGLAGELTKEQKQFANIVYLNNERQLQIINDLLVIANTETNTLKLKKVNTDLRELVDEVVNQQQSYIKSREQTLKLNIPNRKVAHQVDPSFFKMVIDNLLSNASKYTPLGGRLFLSLTKSKDRIELEVSDTGVGIDSNDIDKLFHKFTRIENPLSAEVGGSGIGLYLLKQLVDLHDGEVKVKSKLGKGTTFTVILTNANNRMKSSKTAAGNKKIAVLD